MNKCLYNLEKICYNDVVNHDLNNIRKAGEKVVKELSNSAETIEKLAKQLEQQKIYADLKECETLEDLQKLIAKYKAICDSQN